MKKTISNRIKLIILGLILVAFIAFYFLFKLNFKKPALLNYQLKRRATTMIAPPVLPVRKKRRSSARAQAPQSP